MISEIKLYFYKSYPSHLNRSFLSVSSHNRDNRTKNLLFAMEENQLYFSPSASPKKHENARL